MTIAAMPSWATVPCVKKAATHSRYCCVRWSSGKFLMLWPQNAGLLVQSTVLSMECQHENVSLSRAVAKHTMHILQVYWWYSLWDADWSPIVSGLRLHVLRMSTADSRNSERCMNHFVYRVKQSFSKKQNAFRIINGVSCPITPNCCILQNQL